MPQGKIILRDFKGVNLLQSRRLIADEELRWARNVYPNDRGFIETRPRMKVVTQGIALYPPDYPDLGLYGEPYCKFFEFEDEDGKRRVVFVGWINTVSDFTPQYKLALCVTQWDPITGFSAQAHIYVPKAVRVGGPYTWPVTGFVYENALYIAAGYDPGAPLLKITGKYLDDEDVAAENVAGTWSRLQDAGIAPTLVEDYRGVLAVAGLPGENANNLFFTDPIDKTVAGTNDGLRTLNAPVMIGVDTGDPIVALATTPVWGGAKAVEPYLVVFKRNSVWAVYGTPPASTDADPPPDFTVVPLLHQEGCISPNAVTLTPFGLAWCSGRNVWLLPGAGGPTPIGNKIAPHLIKLPQTMNAAWNLIYDSANRRLQMGVHNPGNETWGTQVIRQGEQWWADLRENPESPQWWGPMDAPVIGYFHSVKAGSLTFGVAPIKWVEAPSIIEGQSATHVSSGPSRTDLITYKTFTMDEDNLNFKDMWQNTYSTQWDIRFKEFDFGDPFLLKIFESIEVEASPSIDWDYLAAGAVPYDVEFQVGNTPTKQKTAADDADGEFKIVKDNNAIQLDGGFTFTDDAFAGFIGEAGSGVSAAYPNAERLVGRTLTPRIVSHEVLDIEGLTVRSHWKLGTLALVIRPIGRRPTSKGQRDP